jgi:hypothetical protein
MWAMHTQQQDAKYDITTSPCIHHDGIWRGERGVVEVDPHSFLTLTVGGGEWSSSYSGHFAPVETAAVSRNI